VNLPQLVCEARRGRFGDPQLRLIFVACDGIFAVRVGFAHVEQQELFAVRVGVEGDARGQVRVVVPNGDALGQLLERLRVRRPPVGSDQSIDVDGGNHARGDVPDLFEPSSRLGQVVSPQRDHGEIERGRARIAIQPALANDINRRSF
jgi:hypothetical protein